MFAEDEQLLPAGIFTVMQKKGGDYDDHDIAWFNGDLFSARDTALAGC